MQQPLHAGRPTSADDFCGQLGMNVPKPGATSTAFIENADQVDDGLEAAEVRRELACVVHIGIDQIDVRQHQQVAVHFAIACEYLDPCPSLTSRVTRRPPTKPVPPNTQIHAGFVATGKAPR